MVEGWNKIEINLAAGNSTVDLTKVNYFRLFAINIPDGQSLVLGLHCLMLEETSVSGSSAAVTATQELKGLRPPAVPTVEPGYTLSEEIVKFADASGSGSWGGNLEGVYSGTAPDGRNAVLASSGHNMIITYAGKVASNITAAKIDAKYAYASFWMYVSNVDFLTATSEFEINSSGDVNDPHEFRWTWTESFLYSLQNGWNKIELKIPYRNGAHYEGNVNLGALNFFRLFNISQSPYGEDLVVCISDITITEKDYDPMVWDESFMRVVDFVEPETPVKKTDVKSENFETDYNTVHIGGSVPPVWVEPDVITKEIPQAETRKSPTKTVFYVLGGVFAAAGIAFAALSVLTILKKRRKA